MIGDPEPKMPPCPPAMGQSNDTLVDSANEEEACCLKKQALQIFVELSNVFGFQQDSMYNMFDHLMVLLDSRGSRMPQTAALQSLHADYLGGPDANYRRWCEKTERRMHTASTDTDRLRQLALWLMLWGEGSNLRFCPELLCFVFQCASDYVATSEVVASEGDYLDTIVTPLYAFLRDQSQQRERDHARTINYDDVNELFWAPFEPIENLEPSARYSALKKIQWQHVFSKQFKEKRSWLHLLVNFTRVWIIHLIPFWFYLSANADSIYEEDEVPMRLSVIALGGSWATLLVILANILEHAYLPYSWPATAKLGRRLAWLIPLWIVNVAPSVYTIFIDRKSAWAMLSSVLQLLVGLATSLYFAVVPMACQSDSAVMLNNFPPLRTADRYMSISLWCCVFGCKFLESYFFVALSFKDPFHVMMNIHIDQCLGSFFGSRIICILMPYVTLGLMVLMELVLFFLDTYLWYIVWNTLFSVARSYYLGVSILTPWRNIFSRLPKRIYAKLLATYEVPNVKPKKLCSRLWNAFIMSMYREHILSLDHVAKLLYEQIPDTNAKKTIIKPPTFFVSQEDVSHEYFPRGSEAERRIQFFAQSLTTPMPEPLPVPNMPVFTVLTPHYSEKILLTLREIIREEDSSTRITLLEYLKKLHPFEWDNFVKDTKMLVDEFTVQDKTQSSVDHEGQGMDDLPFYCVGFKSSAPEYALRTRIWASLRTQTLYRTVTGFMNYHKAIKLLYRTECASDIEDSMLDEMASSKFRFLLAMQRYTSFSEEEKEGAEFLLRAYPNVQIAYLEKSADGVYYSVLIDGHCALQKDGRREPKYRIRLPGNPILGDGKSDNQNNAVIFSRGEYLQLIDANQDNYLEECLKIRNVLGEFEQHYDPNVSPYAAKPASAPGPVAIVGAREYIFSENIGILGDIAAGKEQTFGTLSQRITAIIGGKLHYGHPDFLNAVFMTTRGGVSKAQKGLHLNEDIYAGMNAFQRGGRIKHIEYFQCGKGRDLGFGSILNFVTKIGAGMGEQMLSREYYYLGTQLPLDRFLTFYYAHPGFHINNIFIMLSVQLFMLVVLTLGALAQPLTMCEWRIDIPLDARLNPEGCQNLMPVLEWLKRVVLSIFLVFFISFLPLFLQELTERGFVRAVTRLVKHILSLSPFFEIFLTQSYAHAILNNLDFGGARYIATGRGFATSRVPFSLLYARFADTSTYLGARSLLMLAFASMIIWIPHLLYFWITVLALLLSPFLFNPHQFSLADFVLDYREFLRWLSRGNGKFHSTSWIHYRSRARSRVTGIKKHLQRSGDADGKRPRVPRAVLVFSEAMTPVVLAAVCVLAYLYVHSFALSEDENTESRGWLDDDDSSSSAAATAALIRIAVVATGPIVLNAVIVAVAFVFCLTSGWAVSYCCGSKFAAAMAAAVHGWAVVVSVAFFGLLYMLEEWQFHRTMLGMITVVSVQRALFKILTLFVLTREFDHHEGNQSWWTGRWHGRQLGWYALTQPLREYIAKIMEMTQFAADFLVSHYILMVLFVVCLIPGVDRWHSLMLFWLRPSKQIRKPIYSLSQQHARRRTAVLYGILLAMVSLFLLAIPIAPAFVGPHLRFRMNDFAFLPI
ncbi:1,3-beta-glucan synthase component-domain-containing protein [Dichotomocladium elegans]|nr:1,3-beta-glucan synthase component-domain-containing protein [Dichotomocladium elegans]